jgi:peptidoglycan/LPS O-acetylase OafA/YrhL
MSWGFGSLRFIGRKIQHCSSWARVHVRTYLGDASHALYLVHTFMVTPLHGLWAKFPIPPDAIIAIGLITSVIFAWRVHELVEKPMLSRLQAKKVAALE